MKDPITTNLSDFGYRELKQLRDLINAMIEDGLPEDFENEDVHPMFNKNSGCVFLTNSEYQSAMMNGDKLETWYNCCNCGHEGFKEDCQISKSGQRCNECSLHDEEEEEETEGK